MGATITAEIKIINGQLQAPSPACLPQDTVIWTADSSVGRWVVAFTSSQPFAGNKVFFTGVGPGQDQAKARNAPGEHKYLIFCEPAGGSGSDSLFADPILVIHSALLRPAPDLLREYALELETLKQQLAVAETTADVLQAELVQLAHQLEEPPQG